MATPKAAGPHLTTPVPAFTFTFGYDLDNLSNSTSDNSDSTSSPWGVYGPLEQYTLFWVFVAVNKYYMWVIFVIGFPGNLLSFLTILRMPTVSSSKMHVALLAVVDNCALSFKLLYHQLTAHSVPMYDAGCRVIIFFANFFSICSSWILVAMTVERFIAVWFPLKVNRIYSKTKATLVLLVITALTFGFNLLYFWIYHEDYSINACVPMPAYRDFMKYYWHVADALAYAIIPCFLVLLSNILIIINVQMASKTQRHLTNNFDQSARRMRDQQQITTMLIVISMAFLAMLLPNAVFFIIKDYWVFTNMTYGQVEFHFTKQVIHMLCDLNHAINFYLYFLSMAAFRKRFMDTICCRKPKKKQKGSNSSVFKTSHSYISFHSTHSNLKQRGDLHQSHSLTNVSDVSSEL